MDDASTIVERLPHTAFVPRAATLDGFIESAASADGLNVRDLEPLTTVVVRTRNSRYRMIVSSDTSVIVQGGQFFPDATAGRLDGSSFGGSFLKIAWIGIGMRMEIFANDQRIVTSPVQSISVQPRGSARVH